MNKSDIINLLKSKLQNILSDKTLETDIDILDKYSCDETSDLRFMPDLLVRAKCVEDVSNTLKLCNDLNISVTPRGAGTGVTGGSLPVCGGVRPSAECSWPRAGSHRCVPQGRGWLPIGSVLRLPLGRPSLGTGRSPSGAARVRAGSASL